MRQDLERTAISSSSVADIGYDPETQVLEVGFIKGGVYQYYGVPPAVYDEFFYAGSKGTFLNQRIKPFYAYAKVG